MGTRSTSFNEARREAPGSHAVKLGAAFASWAVLQ